MNITKLKFHGVKNAPAFDHEIKRMLIVTGDNGAGKTSVTDAVRLALLGHAPELGKTPKATYSLCGGNGSGMAVEIQTDTGKTVKRSWKKVGKTIECLEDPPEIETPSIMFDASEFFKMSGKARTEALFKIISKDVEFPLETVIEKIHEATKDAFDAEAFGDVKQRLEIQDQDRVECSIPINDWLKTVIDGLKEDEKQNKTTAKLMSDAIAAKVQLQANNPPTPIMSGIEAKQAANREAILAAKMQLHELRRIEAQVKSNLDKAVNVERLAVRLQAIPDHSEQISALELSMRDFDSSAAGDIEHPMALFRLQSMTMLVANLALQIKKNTEGLQAKAEKYSTLNSVESCPSCGDKNSRWKSGMLADMNKEIADATALGIELDTKSAEAKAEVLKLTADAELAKLADEARSKAKAELRQITSSHATLSKVQAERTALAHRLEVESAGLQQIEAPDNLETDILALNSTLADLETDAVALASAQRMSMARKADERALAESKAMMERTAKRAAIYKAAVGVLIDYQDATIKFKIGAFMDQSSNIFTQVMGKRLEFDDGEIGYRDGARWVSHETFCGAEMLLAYAGLALALAVDSDMKVLIIDEMGVLTDDRKLKLITSVGDMIDAGMIDNFIGIDVSANVYEAFANSKNRSNSHLQTVKI